MNIKNDISIRNLATTIQTNVKMPDRPVHPGYGFNYVAVLMGPDIAPVAEQFSLHAKTGKSKDDDSLYKRLLTRAKEMEFAHVEQTGILLDDLLNPHCTLYTDSATRNHDCSTVTVKGSAIRYMTKGGRTWHYLPDTYQILITESSLWVDPEVDQNYLRELHQWASDVEAFSNDNARKAAELKKLLDEYK